MKKNYFYLFIGILTFSLITTLQAQDCTPPTATISPEGFTFICNSTEGVVLKATEGTGLTYQWKKNGTNILNATGQTYTAKEVGSYSVTVSSGVNCSATSQQTFVQPSQPNAFKLTVNPKKATTCGKDSATLRVNQGLGKYQWYSNGAAIKNATASTFKTIMAGSYYVMVEMQGGCPITSDTAIVSIQDAPSKPTIVMDKDSLVSSSASTYQWLYNDNPIPNATKQKLKPAGPGTYKVRVGSQTCSTTSDAYDFLITATEIETMSTTMSVYPSPFNNYVIINSKESAELTVGFYNNLGSLLFETKASSNTEIKVSDLPTGIYNVKIQSGASNYFTKLIKE